MIRRSYLGILSGLASCTVAGCFGPDLSGTCDPRQDRFVYLSNETEEPVDVTLELEMRGRAVAQERSFTGSFSLAPGSHTAVEEVAMVGSTNTVRVETGDLVEEREWEVDECIDLYVTIREDEIETYTEHFEG